MKPVLTLDLLCQEAKSFAQIESSHNESYLDEIQAEQLAKEILDNPPKIGYLTISNALQWRLQYRRVITEAGNISGIIQVL